MWKGKLPDHCRTVVSRDLRTLKPRKNREFPVKFPVCREFRRRQVRSALQRQPGSPGIRLCLLICREGRQFTGFLASGEILRVAKSAPRTLKIPKVSRRHPDNSLFREAPARISGPRPGQYSTSPFSVSAETRPDGCKWSDECCGGASRTVLRCPDAIWK